MANLQFRENPGIQRYPKNEQEWKNWVNEVGKWVTEIQDFIQAQADIVTAQTSADNAGAYVVFVPNGIVWNADAATGTAPAGNPTADIVATFYNKAQSSVAVRTLRGTLTSAAGTIAVTNVSSSGLTTSYALVNDGTESVQAQITVTFGDGSKKTVTASWNFMDPSVAARTPASGGGK